MSHEILMRALELGRSDEAFAIVGVIRTDGPTAVKAGNRSIIRADGKIEGWVGGHCTEDEILRNALESIEDGNVRTLELSTCHGGTMEIYIEPYPQRRKLLVIGQVPIVGALSRLAKMLDFSVLVVDKKRAEATEQPDIVVEKLDDLDNIRLTSGTYVVIATMGERDQEFAAKFVGSPVPYIGIVAGKKRAHEILTFLRAEGASAEQIAKIKSPAGIYIRAVTAEEIALSILAEIVELARTGREEPRKTLQQAARGSATRQRGAEAVVQSPSDGHAGVVVDPVCGMTVDASNSSYHSKMKGRTIYFCSESCREEFDRNPAKHLLKQRT